MHAAGASRSRIAHMLTVAYGDGLLSPDTFVQRLDLLLDAHVVDPDRVVGDLNFRSSQGALRARLGGAINALLGRFRRDLAEDEPSVVLLALDWTGRQSELIVGRHHGCDVVLGNQTVSRRHAQLRFRDGHWVLQDLDSTNGTLVNGVPVGRCELRPGDQLMVGHAPLQID